MVFEPKSPPPKIPRFSEPERDGCECEAGGIDLGLELGMRRYKYKAKAVDDDRKKEKVEVVSMGFTFMQRIEFEQQACIFKYIQFGVKVPFQLLYPLWKSVERSIDSSQFPFIPNLFGGTIRRSWTTTPETEPGRCKRTDGKKWRCAKEATTDSKYCEKHLHRGRHRSIKLVESSSSTTFLVASVDGGGSSHGNTDSSASPSRSLVTSKPV